MLLESVSSTAKRAEELLNGINDNSIGADSPIRIEDYFTGMLLENSNVVHASVALPSG